MDKIVCVGKNYVDHAKELGDAMPEKPVFFLKPPSVLKEARRWGDTLELAFPRGRGEAHYECEIVLKLGAPDARGVPSIEAVTLGLDLTLRKLQGELKKAGHPWTTSKVFPDAACIGPWIALGEFRDYQDREFAFRLDGKIRQRAQGNQMSMKPEALVRYAAGCFPLCEGDLMFTGTPAGVGPYSEASVAELVWGERHYQVRWRPGS